MSSFNRWMPCVVGATLCAVVGTVWVPGVAGAVTGPKWAVVSSAGVLVRSNGATASSHVSTGTYLVVFSSNMTGCAYEATAGDPGTTPVNAAVEVTVASLLGKPNGLSIRTFNQTTGSVTDAPFHVATYCGVGQSFAVIAATGTTARGSHVVSSTVDGIGGYRVVFDHNVSKCAFTATLGTTDTSLVTATGEITLAGAFGDKNGVFVQIINRAGTPVSLPFHLAVDCGTKRDIGVINSDGSKARGAHVASSARLSTGKYEVIFDRNMTACAYTATIGETGNGASILDPVTITTARRSLSVNGVFVFIHNVSGATQDEPFHLKVNC